MDLDVSAERRLKRGIVIQIGRAIILGRIGASLMRRPNKRVSESSCFAHRAPTATGSA
jgi:hypothetical protein